jgi:4-diphosphocytidyl-2-C-methyl-D-erythritol kinase
MTVYQLLAPAKINLHLEILGVRPDQFHELAMIMQSVALADLVEVRSQAIDRITLHCNQPDVPQDHTNLACRAADLMRQHFPQASRRETGIDITLHKRIPMAAGLAGGSGNAAAVLVGINLLWNLGLTQAELQTLGAELGSDVPFCISGGTAIATGRGEKIDSLPALQQGAVVLGKYRQLSVSTPWAYQTYRQQFAATYAEGDTLLNRSTRVHSSSMVKAIMQQDLAQIGHLLYNDLAKVVLPAYPLVADLCAAFQNTQNLGVLMSGSGPTVFALAEDLEQAQAIATQVRQALPDPELELFATPFSTQGVHLEATG